MKIAVLRERKSGESRVAVTPETVKKIIALGAEIHVESGAGSLSEISDNDYQSAGAKIEKDPARILDGADILLKVQPPLKKGVSDLDEIAHLKTGAIIIGMLNPYDNIDRISRLATAGISAFSLEFIPRISRAQGMDVLSSQSNLAGYKAVLDAVNEFGKVVPMMMTAAGTITPAKVLVLGAGVAGLQAIATAKRLGAVVFAFDVRPVAKEQVESLGATFIEVPMEAAGAETKGGYAREMSEEYKKLQAELVHNSLKKMDIAITTALIPGKPAPVLITEEMVRDMKPGSVIVDLAVNSGGNCPLSRADKIIVKYGVKIVAYENVPSRVAIDASALYARNIYNFLALLIDKETKKPTVNLSDEIIKNSIVTHEGQVVNAVIKELITMASSPEFHEVKL